MRQTYFYLHPEDLPVKGALGLSTPRLFFENAAIIAYLFSSGSVTPENALKR